MTHHTSQRPFADLHRYTALPRLSGLTMSPDGTRLVTEVSVPNAEDTGYVSHLWEVDPTGERPARQLTRSTEGESAARFTADGALWFLSKRPADPAEEARRQNAEGSGAGSGKQGSASQGATSQDSPEPGLWRLPGEGGEAQRRATWPGGISAPVASRHTETVLATAGMLPGAADAEAHTRLHRQRRTAKTTGILHSTSSIRFWDHDLGPAQPQLFALDAENGAENDGAGSAAPRRPPASSTPPPPSDSGTTTSAPPSRSSSRWMRRTVLRTTAPTARTASPAPPAPPAPLCAR